MVNASLPILVMASTKFSMSSPDTFVLPYNLFEAGLSKLKRDMRATGPSSTNVLLLLGLFRSTGGIDFNVACSELVAESVAAGLALECDGGLLVDVDVPELGVLDECLSDLSFLISSTSRF
jgi:hypothetical protein